MLREKIFTFLPQISSQPQYLSHFMHKLINFDTSLRGEWGYDGGNGMEGWKGMTWEVLVKKDWFGRWLQVEKEFALSRYQTIIDTPDSGEIDHDSIETGHTKPTKAAIRVNDLLETITDRYRPLSSFSQKLRFLIDIQIAIFDKLHERLHSSLEAYLTMTSTIGRTVQGASMAGQPPVNLSGIAGLDRLCRVFGSSEYLEKKMLDWSDDLFFLELWAELQDRVKRNRETGQNIAGPMSTSDVAERTSSAVADNAEDGSLFDETASAYRRLRLRSESILEETVSSNIREALRPYGRISSWASLSSSSDSPSSLAPSSELDSALQQLSTSLNYLSSVLAPAPLRRITRQVCLSIQTWMWDHVLNRYSFSAPGATQFSRDVVALWDVVDRAVGVEGEGQRGMKRLAEGVGLLNLPIRPKQRRNEGAHDGGEVNESMPEWGLWDVEERVFISNESAREVLAEMGFENLSEADARGIIRRRVEIGA
jgi:RAD50-interacting protein 1